MLLIVWLAGCRGVAPVAEATVAVRRAPATPTAYAEPRQAVAQQQEGAAAPVRPSAVAEPPPVVDFRLDLPLGWQPADAEGYAFAALLTAPGSAEPAAIATGLFVPAYGLDLPSFVDAAASELRRMEGATVLSAGVDGLLRQDGAPAGVVQYALARHDQLGDLPAGRQYLLAAPAADAFLALTCLVSAAAPLDAVERCDALANAVVFDEPLSR